MPRRASPHGGLCDSRFTNTYLRFRLRVVGVLSWADGTARSVGTYELGECVQNSPAHTGLSVLTIRHWGRPGSP